MAVSIQPSINKPKSTVQRLPKATPWDDVSISTPSLHWQCALAPVLLKHKRKVSAGRKYQLQEN